MIDQEKIGGFLRDLRKEKGQTQEEIAEKFGMSSKSVSRWAMCIMIGYIVFPNLPEDSFFRNNGLWLVISAIGLFDRAP